MTIVRNISNRLRHALSMGAAGFRADERGSFATIVGVSMMAFTLTAGMAVDYTRVARTKAAIGESLDAAVLATGGELAKGITVKTQLRQTFDNFMEANLSTRGLTMNDVDIVSFETDSVTGKISAEAKANIAMAFMGLAGFESVDVGQRSEVVFSSDDVEISMVLDVTGSMDDNNKIGDLRAAAAGAVDILLPAGQQNDRVRIALAPYSWSVNAGNYAREVSNQSATPCMTERNDVTDASYVGNPILADPRAAGLCPSQQIRPLTNQRQILLRDISRLRANGWTAGHIGIAWGYYMLSENWRRLWPTASDPAPYADPVKKIAIIMTDGEFNTYYSGVGGNPFGTQELRSGTTAVSLCNDMKAKKQGANGITIYSIAFDAPVRAQQTLRACATPDTANNTFYYSAKNGAELRLAFERIALDIQKLRITR